MIPWTKLPKNAQRAILAMVILSGEAAAASSCRPMVCDPPPPPRVTPTATATAPPIICDPAPPPSVTPTPTTTATPTISITAPPPSRAPIQTPALTPMIFDPAPEPPPAPDSRRIEGAQGARRPSAPLPLAEIRTVFIYWDDSSADEAEGLTFEADSPWPEARYRWTTSGGLFQGNGDRVTWLPPAEPGRYLLQVVADWGAMGLAVDALVLVVDQDGGVTVG